MMTVEKQIKGPLAQPKLWQEEKSLVRKLLIVLGTPIDDVNMAQALDRMDDFIAVGRATGKGHQIATINADFVTKSLHDPELRHILQDADMATADGMPLVWSARLLGVPIEERVAGVDMVSALAERAAEKGYSIYFLGAAPGVAEQTAQILQSRYPGLQVVGIAAPSFEAVEKGDPAILEAIRAADPDILLVAFGNPKQEKWIYRHANELRIPVMIGVGGSFDFIAGITKRAPDWMQEIGLEWLHRLAHNPRRMWKRYAADLFSFGYFFTRQWWVMRRGQIPTVPYPESTWLNLQDTIVCKIQGRLDANNQAPFAEKASGVLQDNPHLIIDLGKAIFLDSAAIGTLVALTKQARDAGGNLWLVNIPSAISQVLVLLRLDQFFEIYDNVESALIMRGVQDEANTTI